MTPNYCHHCQTAGIIATVNGPTCTHHNHGTGAAWFPPGWEDNPALGMGTAMLLQRISRLEKLNTPVIVTEEFDFA